ncbi:hypothetical protein LOD99_8411 [Oopsacas minuta]|uniref:Uncharacterized protein n=1 Tax=Oopsacas minuta TaxID=111878 RepID=A0AAV7JH72_9METZ|nr:hypothetical protein LOD99_8411 [Oopsacas minuta]
MNEIVKRPGEHFHSPDILPVNCLEVKDRMKRKARQTHDTTHHILEDELGIITDSRAAKLPKLDCMKHTIRRERQVRDITPVQPESLHDIAIPHEFTITAKEENFLLYDSGPELTRILIFGTQKNCDMLTTYNILLADGTFKTSPQLSLKYIQYTRYVEVQTLDKIAIFYLASLYYYPIRPKQHTLECGNVSESFVLQHLQQA